MLDIHLKYVIFGFVSTLVGYVVFRYFKPRNWPYKTAIGISAYSAMFFMLSVVFDNLYPDAAVPVIAFVSSIELTWKLVSNIVLGVVGVSAIRITQTGTEKQQKWASVLGLVGQPAWFYIAYADKNWGIFVLCMFYTEAWLRGFKKHWIDTVFEDKVIKDKEESLMKSSIAEAFATAKPISEEYNREYKANETEILVNLAKDMAKDAARRAVSYYPPGTDANLPITCNGGMVIFKNMHCFEESLLDLIETGFKGGTGTALIPIARSAYLAAISELRNPPSTKTTC